MASHTCMPAQLHSAQVMLHEWLLASPHRTSDPHEADWFYVPVYATCAMVTAIFTTPDRCLHLHGGERLCNCTICRGTTLIPPVAPLAIPIARTVPAPYPHHTRSLLSCSTVGTVRRSPQWRYRAALASALYMGAYEHVRQAFPFWNASGGVDHIWTFGYDEGGCFAPREVWPSLIISHWGNTMSKHNRCARRTHVRRASVHLSVTRHAQPHARMHHAHGVCTMHVYMAAAPRRLRRTVGTHRPTRSQSCRSAPSSAAIHATTQRRTSCCPRSVS